MDHPATAPLQYCESIQNHQHRPEAHQMIGFTHPSCSRASSRPINTRNAPMSNLGTEESRGGGGGGRSDDMSVPIHTTRDYPIINTGHQQWKREMQIRPIGHGIHEKPVTQQQ